ncbi:MAG: polysaccharide biosynthesis/export family protein [Bacteroidota bacterium]
MSNRFLSILALLIIGLSSCVPNRKLVYLQKGDELKEEVVRDSVVRTYQLANYEYRIQPEDILSIRFESLTQKEYDIFSNQGDAVNAGNQNNLLINGYLVDKDGSVEFPEIGKVQVGGFTIHEVESKIKTLAEAYVDEPVVKVRLLNFRVTVLGEVNAEGVINSFNNRVTIMEAIGLAGGFTDLADRTRVKIIRQKNGISEVFYTDLLAEDLMSSEYFFVHQNDILVVSPLKQRPFRTYFGQNVALVLSSISTILLVVNLLNQ